MQAMEIQGGALRQVTLPDPTPQPGEVLIRVAYAGVNRADALQVAGKYPAPQGASPLPGLEVSGTIAALGRDVTGWMVGDAVIALLAGGGYAEMATAPASQLLAVPSSMGLRAAASLPEALATTAMALVEEAHLKAGERVLLHGGASGVGPVMAQAARLLGATVFATVGSQEKANLLQSLGITPIEHRIKPFADQVMEATGGQGVDVIIDILGGPQFSTHLMLLRPGGRLVSLAMLEGPVVESGKISPILLKGLRVSGAMLRQRTPAQKAHLFEIIIEKLWPHVASGALKPFIDQVFPLSKAEKALARMQERLHLGKILLEVPGK